MVKLMSKYKSIDEILENKTENPYSLDYINLNYKNIDIKVYGVLHGITGGTNRDYVKFVNKTINHEKRIKFCEKSMKVMYECLDIDVEDWYQIKTKDAFLLTFKSCINIFYFYTLIRTIIREKTNKKSNFETCKVKTLNDLSGDRKFHLLKPLERRSIAGFPNPEDYFNLNIKRRKGKDKSKIYFSDKDWNWLTYVEPYANIPMRSIHMVEYVSQYCLKNDIKDAALFVGEIHNSDIEWFVKNREILPKQIEKNAKIIEKNVYQLLINKHKYKYIYYLASLFLGALSSISIYTVIVLMLINS
jgi:hypothetical protein